MELCINGCGDIWNSGELLELLDSLLGNKTQRDTNEPIHDTILMLRIEQKVKAKLRKKGKTNDNPNNR